MLAFTFLAPEVETYGGKTTLPSNNVKGLLFILDNCKNMANSVEEALLPL